MAVRRVIHISDLHVSDKKENSSILQKKVFEDDFFDSLKNVEALDTLIISGDIVDRGGSQRAYKKVDPLIKRFREELKIKHILCVPGNHDVSRDLLNGISGNEDINPERLWEYYDEKLKYYWEFVDRNNIDVYQHSGLVSYIILQEPNMIFLGLDSTDHIGVSDHCGFVNLEELSQALHNILGTQEDKYKDYIKIAVLHHRPVIYESGSQTIPENNSSEIGEIGTCDSENWKKVREKLLAYDVHYVLTGHVHGSQSVQIRLFETQHDEMNYSTVGSIGVDFSRELKELLDINRDKVLLDRLEQLRCYGSISGNHNAYNILTFGDNGLIQEDQYKYLIDEGSRCWCRWKSKNYAEGRTEQIDAGGVFETGALISSTGKDEPENYQEKILECVRDHELYKTGHYHWKNTARLNWIDTSFFFQHREMMFYIAKGINELFENESELQKTDCIIGLGIKGSIMLSYVRFLFPDKKCTHFPENKKEYNNYELGLFDKSEKINSVAVLTDVVHSGNTVRNFAEDICESIGAFLKVNVVTIFDATPNRKISGISGKYRINLFSLAELKVNDCQGGGENCDIYTRKLANVIEYKEDQNEDY